MLKNFPELNFVCPRNIGLHSKGARVLKQWLPKKNSFKFLDICVHPKINSTYPSILFFRESQSHDLAS